MMTTNVRFDALLYLCNRVVAYLPSSRFRKLFYRSAMQIDIADNVKILSGLWLDCRGQCRIGEGTVINQDCRLDNRGGIEIGDHVSISPCVHILTADHDLSSSDFAGRELPVKIGSRSFIGSRAIILPGVTLGEGCGVGAGSVVTRDVEPGTIVAGVPAKVIGTRPANLDYLCSYTRHFF